MSSILYDGSKYIKSWAPPKGSLPAELLERMQKVVAVGEKIGWRTSGWKRRRFELVGGRIDYYDPVPSGGSRHGSILLGTQSSAQVVVGGTTLKEYNTHNFKRGYSGGSEGGVSIAVQVRLTKSKKKHHCLMIKNASHDSNKSSRTYYLAFKSEEDRDRLLAGVRHNLALLMEHPEVKRRFIKSTTKLMVRAGAEPSVAKQSAEAQYAQKCFRNAEQAAEAGPAAAVAGATAAEAHTYAAGTGAPLTVAEAQAIAQASLAEAQAVAAQAYAASAAQADALVMPQPTAPPMFTGLPDAEAVGETAPIGPNDPNDPNAPK